MANPRNTVKFDGINYNAQTFFTDSSISFDRDEPNGSAQVGLAVKMTGAKTVGLTTDGSGVVGVIQSVESDDKASIHVGQYVEFPGGDGATLTLGSKIVGDLGPASAPGYIRVVATGTPAELGVAKGEIVDAADPTKTMVKMY
jgi:hypothetical protein